jgi:1-acyl-sn-glycerol-3-phosphate acyltransferase
MVRWIAIFLVRYFVRIFYHHKVFGVEHLQKGGGIIAANHSSYLDPPILGISCPDEVHFLARESLFRFPPFGWLIRQLHTHPVAKGKENVTTFKKACEMIESDKKIAIFPEGTRSHNGEIKKGQAGVGMLVLRTKCKVIPTYIHGTYSIWNSNQKFPKLKGKTACVFGTPLDFTDLLSKDISKKEIQQMIVDAIMNSILSLQKWYFHGAKGTPP